VAAQRRVISREQGWCHGLKNAIYF
jgi:hypothetical protein